MLWPPIRAFVRQGLTDDADAEDAAQNALLKVFSRVSDYDPDTDPLSWSFAIASYEVMTARKKRLRRREESASQSRTDATVTTEEQANEAQQHAVLQDALAQLGPQERDLLLVPPGNAAPPAMRKRKQRALERLRNLWRKLNGPD